MHRLNGPINWFRWGDIAGVETRNYVPRANLFIRMELHPLGIRGDAGVCAPLSAMRKGRMMHYFAYSEHKHESYPCRFSVEDAREDILEEMSNGVAIALQGRNYYSVARIGGTMENVLTLDPVDEYDGPYASISTVTYGDKQWWIEKCNSITCRASNRAGDDW